MLFCLILSSLSSYPFNYGYSADKLFLFTLLHDLIFTEELGMCGTDREFYADEYLDLLKLEGGTRWNS